MSFYQNPIVDEPSKNSEESEQALKEFFNQRNGFICRPVVPDKGTDFTAELILNGKEASNWNFGIQLKSITDLNIPANSSRISYPLRTSRLGYLFRGLPTAGIIVLYDAKSGISYFQYVGMILDELYAEKANPWEDQDWVNIKLPIENKLDSKNIAAIHSHYCSEFRRSAKMKDAFGPQYGLSKSGLKTEDSDFDFNNPHHISTFLEKNGTELLVEYDLLMISALINKLTDKQIQESTKILCLSAIIYGETGKYDQSEVYCLRALRKKDISEDDKISVLFAEIKNQYNLSKVSLSEVIQQIEGLKRYQLSPQSRLTIQINQLYFKLAEFGLKNPVPESFIFEILETFDQINSAKISSRVKLIFTIWNAANLSSYINLIFLQDASDSLLSGLNGQKVLHFQKVSNLDQQFLKILNDIKGEKTAEGNKLIRAYTLQASVKHSLHREITLLNLNPSINNFEGFPGDLEMTINRGLSAYNYFLQEGHEREAYFSLCFTLEFIELGKILFNQAFVSDIESLFEIKMQMENEMSGIVYSLLIPDILAKAGRFGNGAIVKNLTQEQMDQLAALIARARKVPAEYVGHIAQEIEAYREFYRRCNDPNYEIHSLYALGANMQPGYSSPVRYMLKNKLSGLVSAPDYNISRLLSNWGF